MRYIIGLILFFFMLITGVSCSNDGGPSSRKSRKTIEYYELRVYRGSDTGAIDVTQEYIKQKTAGKIINNQDSLYRALIVSQFGNDFKDKNKISFEFLDDDNMLSFIDETEGKIILSSYEFVDDKLFVMQMLEDKESRIFVAIQNVDQENYFRTRSARKFILKEEKAEENKKESKEEVKDPNPKFIDSEEGLFKEDNVFDYKHIKNKVDMVNIEDTVMWCNVKYIYE